MTSRRTGLPTSSGNPDALGRPAALPRAALRAVLGAALVGSLAACQSVPANRYGVQSLEIQGAEVFDPDSIKNCLATQPRDRVTIDFDFQDSPRCGVPPFEGDRAKWVLWSWFWTEWPYYDQVMLEQDIERIERWYAARGHHHAEVVESTVAPESAQEADLLDPDEAGARLRSARR